MKILYIHQHFITNEGSGGTRSYDVSRHMVAMGHQVTILCGDYWQSGWPPVAKHKLFEVRWVDGIKVIRCNAPYNNSMGAKDRMVSFLKFAAFATIAGLIEPDIDLMFATSTPLTVGIPGRLCANLRSLPYVFEVRDLWPEDLVDAGRFPHGSLPHRAFQLLEWFSYGTARKILLVSRGFHDRLLERGFAPERLATIPLGAEGDLFAGEVEPDTDFFTTHGLQGKTVAIYAGSHGDENGLEQILAAASHLLDRPDIALALIGDGKMRSSLIQAAKDQNLTNVYFLPAVSKTHLPRVLRAAHVGLMILKQLPRPRWVTPNKLFDYMFSGLPTIVNYAGTTAQLVVDEQVGRASIPGDAIDLANQIKYFADHPEERAEVGAHARTVAFEKFDRQNIARALIDVFQEAVSQ